MIYFDPFWPWPINFNFSSSNCHAIKSVPNWRMRLIGEYFWVKTYLQALLEQGFVLWNCTESSHSPRIFESWISCDIFLVLPPNPPIDIKNSQKSKIFVCFKYSRNNAFGGCVQNQNKVWRIFVSVLR